MKKGFGYLVFGILILVVLVGLYAVCINSYVQKTEKANIVASLEDYEAVPEGEGAKALKDLEPQCILVLGCGVRPSGEPTPMLRDRLEAALALYREGYAPKILLSGDNGQIEYNELHTMYHYMLDAGVPAEDVFCDHAGFSTYESMYRADLIFQVERMIVVTQRYHMYRALYDAEKLGIRSLGVSADQQRYAGQSGRELREVLARNKDFLYCMIKPDPTFGGDPIPITGPAEPSHGE